MFPQKQVNGGLVVSIQSMQKTGKQVTIPLNQSALNWLPDRNGCKPEQKVFDITCLSACNRCLKKMATAAGIEKNVSFHQRRHSMATLSLAAGGDLYTVGKLLGHTDIRSTQVYADVVMETKIEAMNRISDFFRLIMWLADTRYYSFSYSLFSFIIVFNYGITPFFLYSDKDVPVCLRKKRHI